MNPKIPRSGCDQVFWCGWWLSVLRNPGPTLLATTAAGVAEYRRPQPHRIGPRAEIGAGPRFCGHTPRSHPRRSRRQILMQAGRCCDKMRDQLGRFFASPGASLIRTPCFMDVPQVLVIVGLILINGFFVAAEFALVKVRTSQIDQMVEDGSWAAKLTSKALDRLDAYLSASQLGITVASLALGTGRPSSGSSRRSSMGCRRSASAARTGGSGRSNFPWPRSWRFRW